KENLGITENTNAGLDTVKGDYICFFDHDDTLEPDILFEYACALEKDSDIVLLYCDEDKLLPNGALSQPTFKPDFSIDLLRDNNYVCHMLTVKREVHKKLSTAYKSLDGAQDHSLTLQVAETGGKFCHIPKILYHWRISATSTAANADSKPYATQAGILAVQNHLNRIGVKGSVENLHGWSFRYKTNYEYDDKSLSVVMLPSKLKSFEKWNIESVRVALSSIEAEIIVSDKVDSEVSDVITVPFEGDYVNWVNRAIEKAQNENVIIINSNTFIDGDLWSDIVLGHLSRKDVGIIGTMSCDQYGVVKNAGLAYVPRGIAELSKGMHSESPGYAFRPLSTQNMSAVGCSAVAVRKSDFIKLGCFDEQLEYSLAVVDYCFRVQENGYLVVYTPEVKAVSPMSQDEGYILSAHFLNKWQKKLAFEPDPYFNVNFSREVSRAEQYALS
ncbi:MAG: glycosyltransferase, partial [Anaerotardibacter sp.]